MQNKLQELTGKIYNEGVQKAKDEAQRIIATANEQAAAIIASAQKEAEKSLQTATKDAEEQKRNLQSEVKMATSQALSALKQQMAEVVTMQVIKPSVKELFENKEFVQSLILKVVETWSQSGNTNLDFVLPESEQQTLETFFKNSLANNINKGVEIRFSKQINAGFKAGPSGENYLISFTDNDFTNFLKAYLRPKTSKMLFDN